MIGLTGAQGTGKSTLAGAFSEDNDVPFLRTNVAGTFERLGMNPKADYSLERRLYAQRHILEDINNQYRSVNGGVFVTDRTPICLMAYTLADIQRTNVPECLESEIESYLKDCAAVSNAAFSTLIVIQPGIPMVDRIGRGPISFSYVEHISTLILGLVVSEAIESAHFYVPRSMLELEERVEAVKYAIKRSHEKFEADKARRAESGKPMVFH